MAKCALSTCAQVSYQQAQEHLQLLMGIPMGHSTLHRLVNRTTITLAQGDTVSSHASIDGGKIRLRATDAEHKSIWKDYKAVSLSNGLSAAFFQDNESLHNWSTLQPLQAQFVVLGDGHDGVWNIAETFGGTVIKERLEVLDWFHLMENLHKVPMLQAQRRAIRRYLWQGQLELVWPILQGLRSHQSDCFRRYLQKHRQRLPKYAAYQAAGVPIGSGAVESVVKQIGERVKITGARWKPENVSQILRLRTAYMNRSPMLSIYA